MELIFAKSLVEFQHKTFASLHNFRFTVDKYEYRIKYEGGFACMFKIDRREVGKKNFKYWNSIGGWQYSSASDILEKIKEKIDKEV